MPYRVVHNEAEDAAVVLDDDDRNIVFIHSDGKHMTPAFEPDMAAKIARGLNLVDVLDAPKAAPKAVAA